jgi:hypothetical protein
MSVMTQIDERIRNFVDAGAGELAQHHFVSEDLARRLPSARGTARSAIMARGGDGDNGDMEKIVHYRMNQTGNIFYSTTSDEVQGETKKLFESVTVLFAAMTAALRGKEKTLFDFEAWSSVIGQSGYFVEVQKYQKILQIKSGSVEINTQIVQQLLPGLKTSSSMDIAKNVLSALNGEYGGESTNETTKFGHLLFICEELLGAPSITVRLFYATKATHKVLTRSPCHKSATESFEQQQDANTFLFVSPQSIAEFSEQFNTSPTEYKSLISKLSSFIK